MLGTKALAATWDFIGLDEMKRANVTLRDGSIYPTYMGYVPYIPDVQVAWAKLMNALFGSLFFATIGAGAFAWWFIPWARDRGESIDRKSVVEGKSVSVRVDLGGRRSIKKKK